MHRLRTGAAPCRCSSDAVRHAHLPVAVTGWGGMHARTSAHTHIDTYARLLCTHAFFHTHAHACASLCARTHAHVHHTCLWRCYLASVPNVPSVKLYISNLVTIQPPVSAQTHVHAHTDMHSRTHACWCTVMRSAPVYSRQHSPSSPYAAVLNAPHTFQWC